MADETSGLLDDLVQNQPIVNEGVVANLEAAPDPLDSVINESKSDAPQSSPVPFPAPSVPPVPVQPTENVFNPELHERNSDGSPRLTQAGNFRRKRGKRGAVVAPAPTHSDSEYQTVAGFLCSTVFSAAEAALGEHWRPQETERTQITEATARYAKSKNWGDIPPGIALVLCVGFYALPRIGHPETKVRLRRIGQAVGIVRKDPPQVPTPSVDRRGAGPVNANPTIRNERGRVLSEILSSGPNKPIPEPVIET